MEVATGATAGLPVPSGMTIPPKLVPAVGVGVGTVGKVGAVGEVGDVGDVGLVGVPVIAPDPPPPPPQAAKPRLAAPRASALRLDDRLGVPVLTADAAYRDASSEDAEGAKGAEGTAAAVCSLCMAVSV